MLTSSKQSPTYGFNVLMFYPILHEVVNCHYITIPELIVCLCMVNFDMMLLATKEIVSFQISLQFCDPSSPCNIALLGTCSS